MRPNKSDRVTVNRTEEQGKLDIGTEEQGKPDIGTEEATQTHSKPQKDREATKR